MQTLHTAKVLYNDKGTITVQFKNMLSGKRYTVVLLDASMSYIIVFNNTSGILANSSLNGSGEVTYSNEALTFKGLTWYSTSILLLSDNDLSITQ